MKLHLDPRSTAPNASTSVCRSAPANPQDAHRAGVGVGVGGGLIFLVLIFTIRFTEYSVGEKNKSGFGSLN